MLLFQDNTFQCVLAVDGDVTFALFIYDTIIWTYGSASGGVPAQVRLIVNLRDMYIIQIQGRILPIDKANQGVYIGILG